MQLMTYLGFACQHRLRVLSRREYGLLSKGKGGRWVADRNNAALTPHAWRTILAPMPSARRFPPPWSVERRATAKLLSRDGGWSQDRRDPTACAIAVR